MKHSLYLVFILGLFFACTDFPADVEVSLQIAGKNRKELTKVLRHYKTKQADSLKYKAACFLIDHMKWHKGRVVSMDPHFHEAYAAIDARFRSVSEGLSLKDLSSKEARYVFSKKEKLTKPLFDSTFQETQVSSIIPDLQFIDAAFLIDHIENAFRLKATLPDVSNLPFTDFCNYILPYRSCEYSQFDNGKMLNEMFSSYINNPTAKKLNDRLGWYNTYVFRMKCLYGKCPIKGTTGIYDLFFYKKHDCTGHRQPCGECFQGLRYSDGCRLQYCTPGLSRCSPSLFHIRQRWEMAVFQCRNRSSRRFQFQVLPCDQYTPFHVCCPRGQSLYAKK